MDDCPGNTTPKGERGCSCSLFLSRPKWSEGTRPFRLDGLVGRYRPVPGCRWASGYRPVSGCPPASGYRPVSAGCRWASGCRPGTGYLPISGYPADIRISVSARIRMGRGPGGRISVSVSVRLSGFSHPAEGFTNYPTFVFLL